MPHPEIAKPSGKPGDPDWLAAHKDLYDLHLEKSGGYGTDQDPLANFAAVAASTGQPAYLYPLDRIVEKIARIRSLEAQGRIGELGEDLGDIAGLALCASALWRRIC